MVMIVEFETYPEINLVNPATVTWHGKRSFDLQWISSARPGGSPELAFTMVTLAGHGHEHSINIPYPDFMRLWRGRKETVAGDRWGT
jgi:hypothetical protein